MRRARWNGMLGLMVRPKKALLWRRPRLGVDPLPARDTGKRRWTRAPGQTPPVSHGYGIARVFRGNLEIMWPRHLLFQVRGAAKLQMFATRRTFPFSWLNRLAFSRRFW